MGQRSFWKWVGCLVFVGWVGFLVGCQKPRADLTVVGSTSVEPFAEALAEEYMAHRSQGKIYIQGGGSSAGIQAVRTAAAQVGMSSRNLMPEERDLIAVPIAFDAIAVIVHPSNPVTNFNFEQIRKIFSGQVTQWDSLDGRKHPITLVTREEGDQPERPGPGLQRGDPTGRGRRSERRRVYFPGARK
jgi:phosphate transport system substrate-binding protein